MSNIKTVIITGANVGLGFECAQNIAENPEYAVVLACRDIKKAEQAKSELTEKTGNHNIHALTLDLASLSSVRNFVEQYNSRKFPPLYGIVCNAGINGMSGGTAPDGFDIVFETNHLGHFLLVNLLLPTISPNGRIAVVSSAMHDPPGRPLTWTGVAAIVYPNDAFTGTRYFYSKLCNLYFTYYLAKKLEQMGSGITVNALNPGFMTETNFMPNKEHFTKESLRDMADVLGSAAESGKVLAEMITDVKYEQITGKYCDRGTLIESSALSYNRENAKELWDASVEYTKLTPKEMLPGLE